MILILGGTTEGRTAVKVADEAGKPYFYSTKGEWQEIQCKHGIRITGGMDTEKMESFCRQNNIRLLVDAAHPCEDYADAIYRLEKAGTDRLLALTGVQTIGKLRPYWEKHTCWFRVLERETSITLAQEQGFPKGNLVFYHAGESEALLLETGHSDQGKLRIRRIFGESESGTGCKNPGLCYKTPSPSQAFHDRYR